MSNNYKTTSYWNKVFELLDTTELKRGGSTAIFMARGTILHKNWGVAFEQVVQMMYWVDLISRYQPDHVSTTDKNMIVSDNTIFRLLAYELNTTPEHIRSIVEKDLEYNVLTKKDKSYAI